MYLNGKGDVDYSKVSSSYNASGVSGTVAGLIDTQQKYGKFVDKDDNMVSNTYTLNYYQVVEFC